MAIRKVQSSFYGQLVNGVWAGSRGASSLGKVTRVMGSVANLADDLQGSEYDLCTMSSTAILLTGSTIRTQEWGFAQAVVGADGYTDTLLDVARATGGTSGNYLVAQFATKWNLPLWEQLGMPEDPGGPITIKAFTEGNATVAGSLRFDLHFAQHVP